MSIVVLGESLIDLTTHADGRSQESPGGGPFNIAVGISRLGETCHLLTAIGNDGGGHTLAERLRRDGVRATFHPLPKTSVAHARLDVQGSASYEFEIDGTFELTPEMAMALRSTGAIHAGSIAAHLRPGSKNILDAFTAHRGKALLTYDPNCRPTVTPHTQELRDEVESYISATDVVKASEDDLAWLYPGTRVTDIARQWIGLGTRVVIVTRGSDGIWCRTAKGHEVAVAAAPAQLVDTIGAGDSSMAAIIVELVRRGAIGHQARDVLDALNPDDLRNILSMAARAAAVTCSRAGANPPTAAELL